MKRQATRKVPGMDSKVLMDYDRWLAKHSDEISREYPGKVIAVYRDRLIAVADTYKEVFSAARAQGIAETEPLFTMEVPTVQDMDAIL